MPTSEIANDHMRCGRDWTITPLRGTKGGESKQDRGTLGGLLGGNARKHWDVRDLEPVSPMKSQVQNLPKIHEQEQCPENIGDCGRLFSPVPGCYRHAGPQKDRSEGPRGPQDFPIRLACTGGRRASSPHKARRGRRVRRRVHVRRLREHLANG